MTTNSQKNKINIKLILHILFTSLILIYFIYITFKFKPEPFSDFSSYWATANNLKIYYKGGLLFLLYSPFKMLGLTPYISALIVNSICFIGFSYMLWLRKQSKFQLLSTFILILVGIWLSGLVPIVNSDIPTITFVLLGLKFLEEFIEKNKILYFYLAIITTIIGLSIRSQFLYAYTLILLILLILYIFKKDIRKGLKNFLLFFLASVCVTFIINFSLEAQSNSKNTIQMHKRLTFYTGILESSTTTNWCGGWTQKASEVALSELDQPFPKLLLTKYKNFPKKDLISIILCKWERFLFLENQSSVNWLKSSLRNNNKTDLISENSFYFSTWNYLEGFSVRILKLIPFSLLILFLSKLDKRSNLERNVFYFTVFVLLFFFIVHTILEIQPRYLISPVLFGVILMLYLESGILPSSKEIY